jgi:hypothetical protein
VAAAVPDPDDLVGEVAAGAGVERVEAQLLAEGDGGADCVDYIGYSFWRNTNYHVGSNTMLIFVTLDRNRGGAGPTLFSYDKTADQVTKVRPLFDPSSPYAHVAATTTPPATRTRNGRA